MPEREGFKTIDVIAAELKLTEEQVRTLLTVLQIQPTVFADDRRRRFYSSQDVERLKTLLQGGQ